MKLQPWMVKTTGVLLVALVLHTHHVLRHNRAEERLEMQSGITVEYARKAADRGNRVRDLEARLDLIPEPRTNEELVGHLIRQAILIEGLDWDDTQVQAMIKIAWKESRYNPDDQHPVSTAYGLWQFLDSTWQYYGIDKTNDPLLQTVVAVRYIEDRYGTPVAALEYHNRRNHY